MPNVPHFPARFGWAPAGEFQLARPAVKASTHRVKRAMVNLGYQRPQSEVVINMAPDQLVTMTRQSGNPG